jgi:hypothetical protein
LSSSFGIQTDGFRRKTELGGAKEPVASRNPSIETWATHPVKYVDGEDGYRTPPAPRGRGRPPVCNRKKKKDKKRGKG